MRPGAFTSQNRYSQASNLQATAEVLAASAPKRNAGGHANPYESHHVVDLTRRKQSLDQGAKKLPNRNRENV